MPPQAARASDRDCTSECTFFLLKFLRFLEVWDLEFGVWLRLKAALRPLRLCAELNLRFSNSQAFAPIPQAIAPNPQAIAPNPQAKAANPQAKPARFRRSCPFPKDLQIRRAIHGMSAARGIVAFRARQDACTSKAPKLTHSLHPVILALEVARSRSLS